MHGCTLCLRPKEVCLAFVEFRNRMLRRKMTLLLFYDIMRIRAYLHGTRYLDAHNNQGDIMQKSLHIDPGKCTGCLQCEMACSYEHTGAFNPSKSRIKVFDFEHEGRKVPYTCTQCADAWCLNACPVDAITLDLSTGAKVVNEATCVGCKVCTIACPFGTINYLADVGKVQKCDLCSGDPKCVSACPTGAITYVDADWTGLDRMRSWAAKANTSNVAA